MKANTSVKGHVYDVCYKGCKLYNDESEHCEHCKEKRYKLIEGVSTPIPTATIKILSIGDVISQLLGNEESRKLLRYRADRPVENNKISDYFDGQQYIKFKSEYGAFENPDDVAIALYTDGFINDNKGKTSFTMIHAIILNYDPFLR